jgi:hypothetical protein
VPARLPASRAATQREWRHRWTLATPPFQVPARSRSIMKDRRELARPSAGPAAPTDSDRTLLLECRLEQLRSALDEARAEADRARVRLAEAAAREADEARRHGLLQDELARAREEVAALHRRLEHSEALRAELAGHLFESEPRDDAQELVRLRREVVAARERALVNEHTAAQLRARVDELVASRETLLTRVVEWQRLVRRGDTDAIDLAEFIADLRRGILELEHENALGQRREAALREQLERRGPGSDAAVSVPARTVERSAGVAATRTAAAPSPEELERRPADDPVAALAAAENPKDQVDLLLRLGRSGGDGAFYAVRPWAAAVDPLVRAAAYQALGRLLERDPARLEPHIRWGIADADPHVRRRTVLAAAAARGLALRPLLEPLTGDPDPQVRRIVHQILRRAPPASPPISRDALRAEADVASGRIAS